MSLPNHTTSLPESRMRDGLPAARFDAAASVAPGIVVAQREADRIVHAIDALALCMLDGCIGG